MKTSMGPNSRAALFALGWLVFIMGHLAVVGFLIYDNPNPLPLLVRIVDIVEIPYLGPDNESVKIRDIFKSRPFWGEDPTQFDMLLSVIVLYVIILLIMVRKERPPKSIHNKDEPKD
jgi:hypothetical protein